MPSWLASWLAGQELISGTCLLDVATPPFKCLPVFLKTFNGL